MPSLAARLSWLLAFFLLPSVPPGPPAAVDLPSLQTARNVGLAALEEGDLAEAGRRFAQVRRLAPAEPLGWADGAVVAMRGKDFAQARPLLAEAARLAPSDPRILALEGMLAEQLAQTDAAIGFFERAADANPGDLISRWSAARLLSEKAGGRPRAIRAVEAALEQSPANLYLLVRLSELERSEGDRAGGRGRSGPCRAEAGASTADAKLERYAAEAKAALEAGDMAAAALKSRVVENLLRGTPRYQQGRREVDPGVVGLPIEDWTPALADRMRARTDATPVRFVPRRQERLAALTGLSAVAAAGKDSRDLALAGSAGIVVARAKDGFAAGDPLVGSARAASIAIADVDNSGELDVVTPGALFLAEGGGYRRTPLPPGERVLPVDFDSDGDLDLYVASPSGDRLLRNNLDGTWTDVTAAALPERTASRAAAIADFDRDGDPDVARARAGGGLGLLDNRRGGRLAERPAGLPSTGRRRGRRGGGRQRRRPSGPRVVGRRILLRRPEQGRRHVPARRDAAFAGSPAALRLRQRRRPRSPPRRAGGLGALPQRRRGRLHPRRPDPAARDRR